MASAAEADAGEAGEAGKGKKKLIIIGAAAVVLLLVAGGGAWFFLFSGEEEAAATEGGQPVEVVKPTFYVDLPEMVVNLASNGQRSSFVKISVSLEVPEKEMVDQINPNLPRVLDAFQVYLRQLRVADLQGSAGMFRVKEELQRRINLAVYPARVDDVLFRSILVQ
ncbi:flagellar basal body-associated FliL family protein [Methylobrevis pamukkalensis]|uniref:Flagellar protein FliL n=1 Tax=Methylobrevis pamukkalensis TaxID=1439726 RepID=A0A1E3GZJ7_9HYPH|nr:flagellar basal body-associated FliL family protein [Methylobrevis pamukkalensis]ODN69345.1 Flagellar FliL protein [Methylobrevis pamukkalensis]